jgi:hypothetical protein
VICFFAIVFASNDAIVSQIYTTLSHGCSFTKFFQLFLNSLDHFRFKVSLLLMSNFVPRELHPQPDCDQADLLINLTRALQRKDTRNVNPRLLTETVLELHTRYNINRWLVREETCLLNSVINCLDPDFKALKMMPTNKLSGFFERCFNFLVKMPSIDLDLTEAASLYPHVKLTRPLEVALRGGRYKAAIVLISRKANVDLIDIQNCHFMAGASLAFVYLCLSGYVFPSMDVFQRSIKVSKEEQPYFDAFCSWLKTHRSSMNSLSSLCLQNIKRNFGVKSVETLYDTMTLPSNLLNNITFGQGLKSC